MRRTRPIRSRSSQQRFVRDQSFACPALQDYPGPQVRAKVIDRIRLDLAVGHRHDFMCRLFFLNRQANLFVKFGSVSSQCCRSLGIRATAARYPGHIECRDRLTTGAAVRTRRFGVAATRSATISLPDRTLGPERISGNAWPRSVHVGLSRVRRELRRPRAGAGSIARQGKYLRCFAISGLASCRAAFF